MESFFEEKVDHCKDCALKTKCNPQMRKVFGNGKKKILFIVESPSKLDEDAEKALSGFSGRMIKQVLKQHDIDLYRDCWITYAVKCRMKKNQAPTTKNINTCKQILKNEIAELKPEKIIVLGKVALNTLIGHKTSVTSINKWLGFQIPDQEYKAWIFPIYTPRHLIAKKRDEVLYFHFNKYLKLALEFDKPFVVDNPDICYDPSFEEISCFVASVLHRAETEKVKLVIDIETTGLNPREDVPHEIICLSMAAMINGKPYSICFAATKENIFAQLFDHPNIQLIAHNLKFEDLWFFIKLGIRITNWYADTMLIAHIVDNRAHITALKSQIYGVFGTAGYEKESHKHMKTDPETGLNTLKDMDQNELRKYCALDSWYTLKLFLSQMHHFKYKKAFKFFMEGLLPLIRMQNNGVNIDREYFEKTIKSLDKELASIDCDIMTSKEAIAWKESEDKPLNYQSSPQLKKLFYKILDYKVIKTTVKGNPSVDAEVLEKIKNKFTKNILKQRKTKKNLNFIKFYNTNVQPDGYLHPSYNLHIPKTYRSSSEFQNVPKHDEVAKKLIRRGIIPRPGNFLLEPDYGQLEVRISCCYTHDPALIKYCSDSSTDMHLDQARKVFIMPEMLKKDPLRYATKNGFVFPEFYGSWWGKIAGDLWEIIDKETKQHLKKHGIPGLGRILRDQSGRIIGCTGFYEHLKNIESDMWNRRFKVYTQWKKDIWNFYLKYGYVRSFTGFTYSGPMVRTEVTNYPIQGAAFHCLLYSIINIEKEMMKRNLQSKMIIEIHDAIVFDVVPKEYEILRKIIKYVMTEKIREDWKWINIPLVVEADKSAIDGNWSEMSEIKDF